MLSYFSSTGFLRISSTAFFGRGEGGVYSLTFSASGELSGTVGVPNASHNNDVGIICLRELTIPLKPLIDDDAGVS